jgi:hypothetical protein
MRRALLALLMAARSSRLELTFRIAFIVGIFGLGGVLTLEILKSTLHVNVPKSLQVFVAICAVGGFLLERVAFFVLSVSTSQALAARLGPDGLLWARILTVLLWVCVLPLVCLWAYHQISTPR